jgi:thiamine biosynthesis lipoprotein
MGSTAGVIVVGGPDGLAHAARRRIAQLERRWSRFLPDSEVSRLNAAIPGMSVPVSSDTVRLIRTAQAACVATDGRFDPTVLPALVALGYRESLDTQPASVALSAPVAATGSSGLLVDPVRGSVTRFAGTGFDPGGIGKGLAADMVVEELLAQGATGALVDIGGDVRVDGDGPDGPWVLSIDDPFGGPALDSIELSSGGVATSSVLRRRWLADSLPVHHLVDPATGSCLAGDLVAATVVAPTAWWAEALTKSVLVADEASVPEGCQVWTVSQDRSVRRPELVLS